MAWKESTQVDERAKFVLRLADGERMTDLCREFGISRKTGYKIYRRYQAVGIPGLFDQKRGPKRAANRTPDEIQDLILATKQEKPHWGARKITEYLKNKHKGLPIPVRSTVHTLLDKHGLVKRKRRRKKFTASPTNLSNPEKPNDLWCIDFKGHFKMKSGKYCYPLTLTDQVSRYLLACESTATINAEEVKFYCEEVFKEYGLPKAIRSDNGEPFSSRTIWGLSYLSVWWLRLGIRLERIQPGHPQENGQHERMHRTLKESTTKPPGEDLLHQQEKFELFKKEFNFERPHEALGMKTPSSKYRKSSRKYKMDLPELNYGSEIVKTVMNCGCVYMGGRRKLFISTALRGQPVGLTEVEEDIWSVDFIDYRLGYFDKESNKLSVADSPFCKQSVT